MNKKQYKNCYLSLLRQVFLIITLLSMAACGGGSSGGSGGGSSSSSSSGSSSSSSSSSGGTMDEVLTGTFIPGPAEGIHYKTASQEGLTNANGEFSYQAGETVTFSIGAIELGSTDAAAEVTIFDLLGAAPPATEADLRAAILPGEVTDLDRAVNMTHLLLTLDEDAIPSNGLDLSDWDEQLAAASLSFDVWMYDFTWESGADSFNTLRTAEGIRPGRYASDVLIYLYDTLGITVPFHAVTKETFDYDNDAILDEITVSTYNDLGLLSSSKEDEDANGFFNNIEEYTYDDMGRRLSVIWTEDYDEDGVFDGEGTEAYTYDDRGEPLTETVTETGDDTYSGTRTYTYDEAGYLSKRVTEEDDGADDVIDERHTETWTYNASGGTTAFHRESDGDADGIADSSRDSTYTYDAAGHQLTYIDKRDHDGDGSFDDETSRTYTYDEDGNRIAELQTASGLNIYEISITSTYDGNGNRLTEHQENDSDIDGNPEYEADTTYNYDDADRPVLTETDIKRDLDSDGTFEVTEHIVEEQIYDEDGNRTELIRKEYTDADPDPEKIYYHTYTYNDQGQMLTDTEARDSDGDDIVDNRDTETYTYSTEHGNKLTELYEYDEDGDNDGNTTSDSSELTTWEYTLIDNGLRYFLISID